MIRNGIVAWRSLHPRTVVWTQFCQGRWTAPKLTENNNYWPIPCQTSNLAKMIFIDWRLWWLHSLNKSVELSENEGNYKRKAIIDASISSVDETLKVECQTSNLAKMIFIDWRLWWLHSFNFQCFINWRYRSPQPSVDEDHLCQVTSLTWYRSVVIIFS
jgi:hypothetical protein